MRAHRSALGHLEQVSASAGEAARGQGSAPGPYVRIVSGPPAPDVPALPTPPPVPAADAIRPRRRLVFIDEGPAGEPAERESPRPRSRRWPVAAAAAGLIALAAGAGVLASGGGPSHPPRPGPAPTAAPAGAAAAPTTLPAPVVTVVSTGSAAAAYTVSSQTVSLAVHASGRCWLELRDQSENGPVLFQGTLEPGAAQTFRAVGGLWLRLGNPGGVEVALDGRAVSLPAGADPFNLSVTTATG